MLELILKITPLALVSTISPIVLGAVIFILSKPGKPKRKLLAFLAGSLLIVLLWTAIGYFLSINFAENSGLHFNSIENYIIGFLLLFLGLRATFKKEEKEKTDFKETKNNNEILKWFSAGFILNIFNFSSVIPYMIEVREIGQANVDILAKAIINFIIILCFLFPILFPFCIITFAPKAAEKIIDPTAYFMKKYGRYFFICLFFIFGIYYILKGVGIV